MRVYSKEEFWAVCSAHASWLTRPDFERRWRAVWMLGQAFGLVIDARTTKV